LMRATIFLCVIACLYALPSPAGAAPAPSRSCAADLRVELDRSSFTARDQAPAPTGRQLEGLRQGAERAFQEAAATLCRAGRLRADRLRPFKRLIVQSGSGATESAFYSDAERFGADALIFQWVFVEEKLRMPDKADIETGLSCWADPDAPDCANRMP